MIFVWAYKLLCFTLKEFTFFIQKKKEKKPEFFVLTPKRASVERVFTNSSVQQGRQC